MPEPDPDRLARLERRVAELEARLTAIAPADGPTISAATKAQAPLNPATLQTAPGAGGGAAGPPVAPASWPPPSRPSSALWGLTGPQAGSASSAPPAPSAPRSFADLEEQLSSRLLAWVGGIALVVGAMFFLSLAFSRGWIGPEARVLIALVLGAAALLAGAWLFERGDRTPALVLAGVGVGTGSLAVFAASRLYGFISVEVALLGFVVLAIGTAAIALRANSQAVAAFGIVATTVAPPILGASPNLATVAFLGAALVGTAVISFGRSWPWLALIAFVTTAPQAARWLSGEPEVVLVIAGIGAFWTINALAAAGSALAGLRSTVHRASATLLVLNALFAIGSIHLFLPVDPFAKSAGLLILAGLHGTLALWLLRRPVGRHPFGMLAAGLAAGTLAIGIAIELGGIAVPIGHTVLAMAIAWVAVRFRDPIAAAWAAAIGSLAVTHLVAVEYPLRLIGQTRPEGWPFASPEGITAIVIAAAFVLTGILAWRALTGLPAIRPGLTADLALAAGCLGAIAVIAYATEFEFRPDLRVVAWAMLAAAAFGLAAVLRTDRFAWLSSVRAGAVLIAIGGLVALTIVAPPTRLAVDPGRGGDVTPLLNGESLALAALAAALAVGGWVIERGSPKRPLDRAMDPVAPTAFATAGAVLVYLVSIAIVDVFQSAIGLASASGEIGTQAQVALSIFWVLVGAIAFATGLVRGIAFARMFGLGLLTLATAKVFLFDLASLDVAYRVLSFIGLGGVLLASSFVAARFRAPGATSAAKRQGSGEAVPDPPAPAQGAPETKS